MNLLKYNRFSTSFSIAAVFVVFLSLSLRLHHLDYESLWMDEIRQTSIYHHTFRDIVQEAASQQAPPLDFWVGHVVEAFSSSDLAVRLPAAIFGTGSVFLLMLILARTCSSPVALGAGTIMAMLPFHIYFSQEARPYSSAIFLMLALLLSLNTVLEKERPGMHHVLMLLIVSVAFLHSRALAPLVFVTALIVILILGLALVHLAKQAGTSQFQRRLLLACAILVLSVTLYLPVFRLVLEMGERYAPHASRLDLGILVNGISRFSLGPLWRAYIVQMEPLGSALFPLILIAPILAAKSWKNNYLVFVMAFLLPIACVLHLVIFRAKTGNSFRPPYPMYISPLGLILAAFTCQKTLDLVRTVRRANILRAILLVSVGLAILVMGHRALAFKSVRKKTDWRGLTHYLERSFDEKQVLMFDSLSPYDKWEPTFYGFSRYYKGRTPCLSVDKIPSVAQIMARDQFHEPIFILFRWRDYFLTPYSKYPIVPSPWPPFDDNKIKKDPLLTITDFTGFSVIRNKKASGNLAKDTLRIMKRIISTLPSDASTVELHLASASLMAVLDLQNFEDHLAKAQLLAPKQAMPRVMAICAGIRSTPKPEKGKNL